MGKSQKWSGFESRIEKQCIKYMTANRAKIHKVDPPSKVVGSGRNRQIIYLENPFLDFMGVVFKDIRDDCDRGVMVTVGQSIVIEAKTTERPTLAFRRRGLKDSQVDNMRRWHEFGAIVGLLWEHDQVCRWIPWKVLETFVKAGFPSISFSYGVEVPENPWPDFLDHALERA